jgi:ribosomal protein S18 acetylase RimI-like enzyme
MKTFFEKLTLNNIQALDEFLDTAGSNTFQSFRYFNSRPRDIIKNHLSSYLLYEEASKTPIGYGHLDPEGDKVWLGIAIRESCQGKGYGKLIMQRLINDAMILKVDYIHLTVDKNNLNAVKLYESFGFVRIREISQYFEYKKIVKE